MKKSLLLLAIGCFALASKAQLKDTDNVKKSFEVSNKDTVCWVHTGIFNIGLNEGFLHNWAAGGEVASLTVNGIFSGNLTRLYHRQIWSNNLDLSYALFYANSNNFVPRKVDDRIDFTSKYGSRLRNSDNIYFAGLFNFKSQFTKGYDYSLENWDTMSTSKFLSPAYLTLAAGMEYRKGTDISLFLSPLAARVILVNKEYTLRKPEGAFGVEYGKTSRFQLGAYFSGRYSVNINKNMLFKTRLDLYSDYLAKNVKDSTGVVVKRDNPGNIDVMSDNLFSYKLGKFINLTLAATFIYDNDFPYDDTYVDANGVTQQKDVPGNKIGWLQIKQIFSLGFEYKF